MDRAERIYQELLQEKMGIWYVSDSYGSKIMLKVPSSTLKAIIKGCKLELIFGIDDNIFHIGAKIYDDPVNFLTITCAQKNIDEHFSIAKIMNLNKVQVQFCNELSVCQAFGDVVLEEKDKNDVLVLLGNPKKFYGGNYNKKLNASADNFQYSLGLDRPFTNTEKIKTLGIKVKVKGLQSLNNCFYGDAGLVSTEISDTDEGKLLEKEVFITLNSLFGSSIYLSPQVSNKNRHRELIDILAFSDIGIFLIESKALGVTNASKERTMDRKIKGLQKQIEKAINQLVGAHRKIIKNEPIYTSSGQQIQFNRSLPPCGIILVSELLPFGDWDYILSKLIKAMSESGILLHLMDFNEMMQFIGHSRGDKYLFDNYLFERIKNFTENPGIYREAKFIKT